ncbi:MAG TPA: 3-phosphoshikimate 1-carboxyvinyltransferase, partial [Acidimicrobiia bacterium]|nr:3-phosphoshikimate 1-carboxyvinyltransferase [Acidimicrobiia bacterium]
MTDQPYPVPVLERPPDTSVPLPGSKSETIRALAAAALASGRSHLYAPLRADDTEAMVGALETLGVEVGSGGDPWTVDGAGGRLKGGASIDVNESGLSARILIAMAGSAAGTTRIEGRGRLPERPMGGITEALRSQGVEVSGDVLPLEVTGRGHLWGGQLTVDCSESSQFATAAMLVAPVMEQPCVLDIRGLTGSEGYLDGTVSVMRRFGATVEKTVTGYEIANDGYRAADVVIEPDASAAVYPMAMAAITGGRVVIENLGLASWQPDVAVASVLQEMGCDVALEDARIIVDARNMELGGVQADMSDAPDGALAVAVVALFASSASELRGLGSLRHKESDRLVAICNEMRRIGGDVDVVGENLLVRPSPLHGGVIDPHGDHRIAMSMACAGTRVPGV